MSVVKYNRYLLECFLEHCLKLKPLQLYNRDILQLIDLCKNNETRSIILLKERMIL